MKKIGLISIIVLGFLIIQSCTSTKETVTGVPKSKVIKMDGKSKNELYINANTWMVETFSSAKSVVQFTDKEDGIVIGKYLLTTNGYAGTNTYADIHAIIKIQVKDDASKITITPDNFNIPSFSPASYYSVDDAIKDINNLIDNYSMYIKNTETSNW